MDLQFFSRVFPQPFGDLHRTDVVALAMMGAALRHQHPVPVPQAFHRGDPFHCGFQIALVPGHQDGEGGERDAFRHDGADRPERLAVRDHHRRGLPQLLQRRFQLRIPADTGDRPPVQQVADRLLLGQDQPSLRRGFIHGADQHADVPRLRQIPR